MPKEDPVEVLIAAWIEAKTLACAHLFDLEDPSEDAQRRPSVNGARLHSSPEAKGSRRSSLTAAVVVSG
jgi:hypothetical protein